MNVKGGGNRSEWNERRERERRLTAERTERFKIELALQREGGKETGIGKRCIRG